MRIHRCRICGESFLGVDAPSNCPFCGAHREHFVDPKDFPTDINDVVLTELERADLESAVELERSNTRFYLGMAEHKDNDTLRSTYKRLARIEAEHCSVFSKLLGQSKPADLTTPADVPADWRANIDESLVRENRASGLYAQFAAQATSLRLREIFEAVSVVELDHIALDEVAKSYL